ncbi:MAG: hypothetical protein JSV87_04345 [Candidatus Bathyarchaeota archaeon]|nr:MAG: hypothetical protein JSV87_04345 [Candidatus Bathyarchaeota archaeon]
MNTMQVKISSGNGASNQAPDDLIPCNNPRLLVALLKRTATVAKENFRSTEAEMLWMFSQVDRVEELQDKLKEFIMASEKKSRKRKAATKKGLPSKGKAAEEKVSASANPNPTAIDEDDDVQYDVLGRRLSPRTVTRSDYGKKRTGKALENIRAAHKRRKAERRLKSRMAESSTSVAISTEV